jgi:hypothetical protein
MGTLKEQQLQGLLLDSSAIILPHDRVSHTFDHRGRRRGRAIPRFGRVQDRSHSEA